MSNTIQTDFGYEMYWAKTESYASKILVFKEKDSKLPLHFYKELERTWFVNGGEFSIRWINTDTGDVMESSLKEGQVFHIAPLMPVSLIAKQSNSSLTEVNNSVQEDKFILSQL